MEQEAPSGLRLTWRLTFCRQAQCLARDRKILPGCELMDDETEAIKLKCGNANS